MRTRGLMRMGAIVGLTLWPAMSAGAQAPEQRSSVEVGATVSRWRWAPETATTLAVWTSTLAVDVTRWSGSGGRGASVLFSPGDPGSAPPLLGLNAHWALRSSSDPATEWRPSVHGAVGLGLLNFFDYIAQLPLTCDYSGRCKGDPAFRPGWVPFVTLGAGLDVPLPLTLGVRAEGALDLPVRIAASPGGGKLPYLRFGLGLTVRP